MRPPRHHHPPPPCHASVVYLTHRSFRFFCAASARASSARVRFTAGMGVERCETSEVRQDQDEMLKVNTPAKKPIIIMQMQQQGELFSSLMQQCTVAVYTACSIAETHTNTNTI